MGGGLCRLPFSFSSTRLGRGAFSLSASAFCCGTAKEEPTKLLGYEEYCPHFVANRE